MSDQRALERQALRLVHCYPKQWRARYGDEFTQLLIDELTDGELSASRKLDVFAHAVWTRLTYAARGGSALDSERRMPSMLSAVSVVSVVFVMLAVGVWAQLTVGWQWSAPGAGTSAAMWLMSVGLFGLGALAVLVTALLALRLVRVARGGEAGHLRAVMVWLAAAAVLYLGCRHFGPHWPGTGGHRWSGRGLAPAWLARLSWAGTLWISSYWAHPVALGSFPATELAWMVISPAAWLALIVSTAVSVRRLELTPKLQRVAVALGALAGTGMVIFLAGAGLWVFSDNSGPRSLFAVGAIDFAIVAILAASLITTTQLLSRMAACAPGTAVR